MKKIFLCTLLALSFYSSYSFWGEPIRITYYNDFDSRCDFCIDNNGIIHVVWARRSDYYIWDIYYINSEDDGQSWSEPLLISENDNTWMSRPFIVTDSNNNLFVTYLYNLSGNTELHCRKFDGESWLDFICLSDDMYGVNTSDLIINNNDTVYAFWILANANGEVYYRCYENDQWGDIICPYGNNDEYFSTGSCVVDSQNNIHTIGVYHDESGSGYDEVASYYYFDYQDSIWYSPVILGTNTSWNGRAIAIDLNELPHVVWRQIIDNMRPTYGTMYSYNDGTHWTNPVLLFENGSDHSITFDVSNIMHIICLKEYDSYNQLVYNTIYENHFSETTILEEIDDYLGFPKILYYNNSLYMIYVKSLNGNIDLFFNIYHDITSSDNYLNNYVNYNMLQVYPNPFNINTNIQFNIDKTSYVQLNIFNLKGQLIKSILNEYLLQGQYSICWNGKNDNGNDVSSGLYLVKLNFQGNKQIKSIILLK